MYILILYVYNKQQATVDNLSLITTHYSKRFSNCMPLLTPIHLHKNYKYRFLIALATKMLPHPAIINSTYFKHPSGK